MSSTPFPEMAHLLNKKKQPPKKQAEIDPENNDQFQPLFLLSSAYYCF